MANTTTEQDYLSLGEGFSDYDDSEKSHLFTISRLRLTEFRDLDIKFRENPSTGDVIVKTGDIAVKQSIKNLLLTDFYERRMRPGVGSGIKKILFEPADVITEIRLKDMIDEVITNYIKEVDIHQLSVKTTRDGLGYDITLVFTIKGKNQPITFFTFLEANI